MSPLTLTKPGVGAESRVNIVPARCGKVRDATTWVTVVSAFQVPPEREQMWIETWQALGEVARSRPECRDFEILRDRRDLARFLVVSEWRAAPFHRFVRETSLLWLDRVFPGLYLGSELTIFEHIDNQQRSEGDPGE